MSNNLFKIITFFLFKLKELQKKWGLAVKHMNLLMIMAGNLILNTYINNQKIVMYQIWEYIFALL